MTGRATARIAVLLAALALSPPGDAAFHLMKVVEVFAGTPAAPTAHYVVLQMYSGGQNQVTGHGITVYDASGAVVDTFSFTAPVASGANQSTILIATPAAATFFNVAADLTMNAVLPPGGGAVCFDALPEDCVGWGSLGALPAGVGTPFLGAGGIPGGVAAVRRLDIAGGASTLEAADDTDNSANDFLAALPSPRNNAGLDGTIPASVCGNSALEGLEQCDDGGIANGDGCSAECVIEIPVFADGFEPQS